VFFRNIMRGYGWRGAMPSGYGLSLIGVLVFGAGGVGDMIWHIVFGVENDLEALLSPTHLLLAVGWVLIAGGPLRAAWQRAGDPPSGRAAFPEIFALTFILSSFTFFTVYANPFTHVLSAGSQPEQGEFVKALGVTAFLIQPALLMGVILLALQRWILPFGSMTLLLTLNTALLSVMHDLYIFIPIAALAGLVADGLLHSLRPSVERPMMLRVFAFAVPAILYTFYFMTLLLTVGIAWSTHLWTGAIVLGGMVGLLLSYLVVPPPYAAVRTTISMQ
jgi:hypothetical protein